MTNAATTHIARPATETTTMITICAVSDKLTAATGQATGLEIREEVR
jgi:hypothetical protein